ncbi:hypothetical protein BKA57DRAFT_449455 [Linnemannia elongata]|nr:hypothetical protein BGZ88_004440 [Linnemannia elongata]KAF9326516.1 hypothetical protein BGZ91_001896 [Linnemannia elongata]KAG0050491.1 hypothetical protein BGZ90_007038 [Linnemannia elongata]KAG0059040.1 hypothetical protein BGZ89_000751 [Linnemannia elongata]KAH7058512.1 hypothetical protein BKA57DRAFT_449455 [Linnemannia elongata]
MAAFRTNSTIARSILSAVSRRTLIRPVLAPAARSFSILAKPDATTSSTFKSNNNTQQKQGFATSLADFSIKSDDSLDQAQQYMDEGVSFQANNMLPLAMSSFQKSINVRPTAAAHYNMGVCYFQLGDFQSSINSFQESLKLSPHHADVHTNIATAHIKLNSNLDEALRHLQAAANIAPQDAEIQFNLAVISEQTGDFDGAINAYTAAVDLGIETASVNLRNVKTKKFAKLAKEAEFRDAKN